MTSFKILHKDGKARVGRLTTPHGIIETPNFVPVGTQASVKALSPKDLKEIGVQMVLANTYHLMLRPGVELIKKLGGLHKFMGWDGPIMTDSGGFQVFSLGVALEHGVGKMHRDPTDNPGLSVQIQTGIEGSKPRTRLNRVTAEGVVFQSHLDGSQHILTPEKSVQIQANLGADLVVAFDDHESSRYSKEEMLKSLELTEKWALRSLEKYKNYKHYNNYNSSQELHEKNLFFEYKPLMYGVVHGAWDKELRIRSAKFTDKHFEAIAIGGIYETKKTLYKIIEWVVDSVDQQKPKHALGIGEVEDLFECIGRGVDLFDCVAPTRRARNGSLYINRKSGGKRQNSFTTNIGLSKYTSDSKPIDSACQCYTCQNFSRAYLRHLYMAKELLFYQLATYHNIYFITNLVRQIRESIQEGKLKHLKREWLE